MTQPINIYVDTSVFGGVHDDEFSVASRLFFEQAEKGRFSILISQVTLDEIALAPENVREVVERLPPACIREVPVKSTALDLAQEYIASGAIGEKWLDDALHVAIATLESADLIVSWNFKHLVNYDKIRQYNAVNKSLGYKYLDIRSPLEVVYGDES